jgi:hypothetical protein
MNYPIKHSQSFLRSNRTLKLVTPLVLIVAMALFPAQSSFAKGATTKVSIITGTVEECGGPTHRIARTFIVTLHVRPSGRVIAEYIIKPSAGLGLYAFRVDPGTYYLTTNEKTSPPRQGTITILSSSSEITLAPIATTCQ